MIKTLLRIGLSISFDANWHDFRLAVFLSIDGLVENEKSSD